MAVQLLEQDGLGAAHGGAHAPGGQIEGGGDLGVAEAAVPEHQRRRLLVRQAATVSQPPASAVGTVERPKERKTSWATSSAWSREPRTRAAVATTRA